MKKILPALVFIVVSYNARAQNDSIQNLTKLANLSLEELMNMKVATASGIRQTIAEAPSTIITAQQIADRGYEQLEDALRNIPGIEVVYDNGHVPTLIFPGKCGKPAIIKNGHIVDYITCKKNRIV